MSSIMYFSAVAHHRESRRHGTVARQVAHFKAKTQVCPLCGGRFVGWEEKETDVAIGATLLELICRDVCETAVLVTGDTDLVPAMRAARRLDPAKHLVALQPYRRG